MSLAQGGPRHPVVVDPERSTFLKVPEGFSLGGPEGEELGAAYARGIVASGIAAGLKDSGRRDMGVVAVAEGYRAGSTSAVMLTENAFAAAPVVLDRTECDLAGVKAVVVNSGNANACTGEEGIVVARATQVAAAGSLKLPTHAVAVASTGIIGVLPDGTRLAAAAHKACDGLEASGGSEFAKSIMTTDRFVKTCVGTVETASGQVRIGACAKGAGMIAPAMATMLCFVATDARLAPGESESLLRKSVDSSFNRVTVDGEMSTNDSVFLLATGASGVNPDAEGLRRIGAALEYVLTRLALMMVADGEGATKVIRLRVEGAGSATTAERVARSIADSPLVKTAMHGCDPNWGRVISSAGAALAGRQLMNVSLRLCGVDVVERSAARDLSSEETSRLTDGMRQSEIDMVLNLDDGDHSAEVFFADMGHEYVKINAEYHS